MNSCRAQTPKTLSPQPCNLPSLSSKTCFHISQPNGSRSYGECLDQQKPPRWNLIYFLVIEIHQSKSSMVDSAKRKQCVWIIFTKVGVSNKDNCSIIHLPKVFNCQSWKIKKKKKIKKIEWEWFKIQTDMRLRKGIIVLKIRISNPLKWA